MNICKHFIFKDEIIGISPVMTNHFMQPIDNLYKRKQYYFLVHCRQQSIKIESDIVETANADDSYLQKTKKHLEDFLKGYEEAKSMIINSKV